MRSLLVVSVLTGAVVLTSACHAAPPVVSGQEQTSMQEEARSRDFPPLEGATAQNDGSKGISLGVRVGDRCAGTFTKGGGVFSLNTFNDQGKWIHYTTDPRLKALRLIPNVAAACFTLSSPTQGS